MTITMPVGGQGGGSSASVVAAVGGSNSFTFALPKEAVDAAANNSAAEIARATLPTGQTLPPWLSFSPTTRTFVATDAPQQALPLTVLVHITSATATTTMTVAITR